MAVCPVFSQNVGAGAGGVFFVAGSHVAGTHRAAAQFGFAAIARAVALLGKLQRGLVFVPKIRFKFGRGEVGLVAQKRVHGRRIHDFARIKNAVGVPRFFNGFEQFVVVLPHHLRNKLAPQAAIAVFARERAVVFFDQRGYFFGNGAKLLVAFFGFKIDNGP